MAHTDHEQRLARIVATIATTMLVQDQDVG